MIVSSCLHRSYRKYALIICTRAITSCGENNDLPFRSRRQLIARQTPSVVAFIYHNFRPLPSRLPDHETHNGRPISAQNVPISHLYRICLARGHPHPRQKPSSLRFNFSSALLFLRLHRKQSSRGLVIASARYEKSTRTIRRPWAY